MEPSGPRHVPAVAVFAAVATGIVADWCLGEVEWVWWWWGAVATAGLWGLLLVKGWTRTAAVVLLVACGLTGAGWHHTRWSLIDANDLLTYATPQPLPVRLRAVIDSQPVILKAEPSPFPTARPQQDRTQTELRVVALLSAGGTQKTIPVSGRARLDVQGALPSLARGAEVELWGLLSVPGGVRNPGGFDYNLFLRERDIHTQVRCEFPQAVQVVKDAAGDWFPRVATWQAIVADRLRTRLSPENAPLAIALLLGPRTDIAPDLKQAFLQSGMVHFLAISGINVAILVLFLWPWGRMLRLPRRLQLLVVGLCVAGYVSITDADPPVVRAAVLVAIMLVSLATGRPATPLNQLAVAGLLILIVNPHDLFQVGAQLSFLAIVALNWLWSVRWLVTVKPSDPLEDLSESWWGRGFKWMGASAWAALVTTTAVWIFTLPLVLARFHLVSPVGFVLNVVLSFWITFTLAAGYAYLVTVLICPPAATLLGPLFDLGLSVFAGIVHYAADFPYGHFQLPGPPDWWLWGYYLLLLSVGSGLMSMRASRVGWRLLLVWCVVGLAWGLPASERSGVRCTFLSVGHGVAILIELPNRQTILYDAGSLENGNRARQVIESALVARGVTRIDTLIISHADIDHFNAVPGLLQSIPIGQVLVSPKFLDFHQRGVGQVCEVAVEAGVPIRLVWAEDRLRCDPDVSAEILLPPAAGLSPDDNANSIVLSLRYAGRGLLLTGDLERAGLQALLQLKPRPHDILLAPHHGSLKANPPDLARWVMPRWVVVSGGGDTATAKLKQHYGEGASLLTTSQLGAVTLELTPEGDINVETVLKDGATR